jgi:polygalacturonase
VHGARRLRGGAAWLLCVALSVAGGAGAAGAAAPWCPPAPADAAPPAEALDVRRFGAVGDGRSDDTAALRRALAALTPGQWLVFPAGTYVHSARLTIETPRVTLHGHGATLHATNPADQALLIQADGVRVRGFTLTAITDRRRGAPWESRIAVWRDGRGLPPLTRIEIRDNRIVESGAPDTPRANSSSSAAIFVHNARHFVVERNLVRRSLSDAIHITGGSRHGRILGNTVRESGDDMVGVVSYLGSDVSTDAPITAAAWAALREEHLVRDILIADNDLSGQYWGRGVTVVGGQDVTIAANTIDATAHAAAVYLSRESSFNTFGVHNVRVQGNRISRVQTEAPAYSALPLLQRGRRTGHGAVELVVQGGLAAQGEALTVREVAIEGNQIDDTAAAAVRIGAGSFGRAGSGVDRIVVRDNRLHRIGGTAIDARNDAITLHCSNNTLDGKPATHARCAAPAWTVTGAAQGCRDATRP